MRTAAPPRSPRSRLLRQAGGWLAVVAMVLLASPGVQVVRAESPAGKTRAIPLGGDGAMCPAAPEPGGSARAGAVAARIAERLRAQAAEGGDVVVLNGRGSNYPSGRRSWHEIDRIEAEAAASR